MKDQVDLVITVPTEDLLQYKLNARRKYQVPEGAPEEAFRLYNGNDKLLVRTALVRSADYKEGRAPTIHTPTDLAKLCRHLTAMDQEYMVTVAINNHYKVVAIHEVAIGGRTDTAVAVKDLAKVAMLSGAHAIFIVHNHPSGDPHPSHEDLALTDAAKRQLKCLGVELLDHVIVGAEGHYSIIEGSLGAWCKRGAL